MNDIPTRCVRCGHHAVAVFYFSQGCLCDLSTVQPLCAQHAFKSEPAGDGGKELIKDLTQDLMFTKMWLGEQC